MQRKRTTWFVLAVSSHVASCYTFGTHDWYTGTSRLEDAAWVLFLALAVVFWVLRARVRGEEEQP